MPHDRGGGASERNTREGPRGRGGSRRSAPKSVAARSTGPVSPELMKAIRFASDQFMSAQFGSLSPAVREAVISDLNRSQEAQTEAASSFFTRRGISGGAAELNALQNLQQEQASTRTTAIADLGAREVESANIAEQSRLLALAAGVETLALPDQLAISAQAARNAGQVQSSGGGGKI